MKGKWFFLLKIMNISLIKMEVIVIAIILIIVKLREISDDHLIRSFIGKSNNDHITFYAMEYLMVISVISFYDLFDRKRVINLHF